LTADERLVSPEPTDDADAEASASLRPRSLAAFVGQAQLRERLGTAMAAASQRAEALEHTLFSGPPGLGKTTLAGIIAAEMGGKLITTSGPALEKTADLMGILTNLQEGDILFVDEIHRIPRTIEEYLYSGMEDFAVDFVLDKGPFAKAIRLTLKRFTLVGATTRSGLLSSPLRDRFGLSFHLDFYQPDDLGTIVERSAGVLKVQIAPDAAWELACRSRGTPRIANRLLRRVRDFAQVRGSKEIDLAAAREALELEGVDNLGLDDLDRKVLETIITRYDGGPVGIEALAATIQQEVDTLTDVVEPYLLQAGFLTRTANGRKATYRAFEHLKLDRLRNDGQPPLPLE
jgi:Holliday junction DNA helicase RuvB